jgi:hypothetical protein
VNPVRLIERAELPVKPEQLLDAFFRLPKVPRTTTGTGPKLELLESSGGSIHLRIAQGERLVDRRIIRASDRSVQVRSTLLSRGAPQVETIALWDFEGSGSGSIVTVQAEGIPVSTTARLLFRLGPGILRRNVSASLRNEFRELAADSGVRWVDPILPLASRAGRVTKWAGRTSLDGSRGIVLVMALGVCMVADVSGFTWSVFYSGLVGPPGSGKGGWAFLALFAGFIGVIPLMLLALERLSRLRPIEVTLRGLVIQDSTRRLEVAWADVAFSSMKASRGRFRLPLRQPSRWLPMVFLALTPEDARKVIAARPITASDPPSSILLELGFAVIPTQPT